ncbi:hypothetical protein [Pseudonocardia humida]|uniref:Carboxypeptidase regulatory-like domain-containing protein n=1 Tax=Pseudonocardia humida TaxID=2800819 RepID=A0ABT0ZU91_9PSEU|nr:hypothetical protein [Pseudonocardia humida]MCO1654300.1 hypothetical protein [Pseudonocardia humida]
MRRLLAAAVTAAAASIALTTLTDPARPDPDAGPATTAFTSVTTFGTTVDDPPAARSTTGGLSVALSDPVTGAPIGAFCVELVDDGVVRTGCTDTGTLELADVPEGDYLVLAYRAGQSAVTGVTRQAVVAGEVARVVVDE